jgi:hypothetical protein
MRVNGKIHPLDYETAERIRNSISRAPAKGCARKIWEDLTDEKA